MEAFSLKLPNWKSEDVFLMKKILHCGKKNKNICF